MKHIKRFLAVIVSVTLGVSLIASMSVLAAPPYDGTVSIGPEPAYTDTVITATLADWVETEVVGEMVYSYEWQKSADGTTWETIIGATEATLDSSNTTEGDHIKVICTPSDDTGDGVPAESNVIIIANKAPYGGSVAIGPDPAYTDTAITATPAGWVDDDGNEITYGYEWRKSLDGATWETVIGATDATLDSSNFVKGDYIMAVCTPFDGTDYGLAVESNTIIIANKAPYGGSVSIGPEPIYTDTDIVATPADWVDDDGDTITYEYEWQYWDGDSWEPIVGAPTTDTLPSSLFSLSDQIRVICTPFDGTDYGLPAESNEPTISSYAIAIDVKPGSDDNPINLGSKGVIPVAIITTGDFDATTVDPGTVRFGPGEASAVHSAIEDIDGDGDDDMILHFRTQSAGIGEEDTEVVLTGATASGGTGAARQFTGTDTIKIVPSKAKVKGNEATPIQSQEQNQEQDQEQNQEQVKGNDAAPGQNKEPGESATGKAKGKEEAPGQNKEPGDSATGKAKGKNK